MAELIAARKLDDPLYIVDLGAVARLYERWTQALPRVTPFYAVKCFTDRAVVATLAALGAGFDCASAYEVRQLTLMLSPSCENLSVPTHLSFTLRINPLLTRQRWSLGQGCCKLLP